jgi:hypothetical protein
VRRDNECGCIVEVRVEKMCEVYARVVTGWREGGVFVEQEKVQSSAAPAKGSPLGMEEALAAATKGATLAASRHAARRPSDYARRRTSRLWLAATEAGEAPSERS